MFPNMSHTNVWIDRWITSLLKFTSVEQISRQHHRKHHHVTHDQKLIELLNQLIIIDVIFIQTNKQEQPRL